MNLQWRGGSLGLTLLVMTLALGACERDTSPAAETDTQAASPVPEEETITEKEAPAELLKPQDLGPEAPAIYFTAGLDGYTEPCGCTADILLGGIDRITAFVDEAKKLHPQALMIDAGDWLFEHETIEAHMEPQERAKAAVLAAAHRKMGTRFSVPGPRDLALGVDVYREMMEAAGMTPLSANLTLKGQALQASDVADLGDWTVAFVGLTQPALVDEIAGVEASDDAAALRRVLEGLDPEVDARVLVYQGSAERAEELAAQAGVDFVIRGHNPEERVDAVALDADTYLLEAYDQGRYVGRLKLYGAGDEGAFVDARAASSEARAALRTQMEHVEGNLRLLDVRTGGEETPLRTRLSERVQGLKDELSRLEREGFDVPEQGRAFIFEAVDMQPGYRLDDAIKKAREDYNANLAELNAKVEREVPPVEEGQAFYIGTAQCATCHVEAHAFWEGTAHAGAVATLEERDKAFDQSCIGCHVVGWEQPGGSVLGKITYEAELAGQTYTKDLNNVGCESCHGPGSNHRMQPLDASGTPQHILRKPTAEACATCHVDEHSPRFDFDVYVRQITGEGHAYSDER
ncbi:multiheme c-type cytochrome [Lujinxingia litoralis]|nr:multiheme c-type cytochrome [Lujinxingia litoralis]